MNKTGGTLLNVKSKIDYFVSKMTNESLYGYCTNEKKSQKGKRDKKMRRDVI